MLERAEVYRIIDRERAYQDKTYSPSEVLSSGVTRGARDLDVTPGLVLLDAYVLKAKEAWVSENTSTESLQYVAKIAAIAVRILERAGGSQVLWSTGLRPYKG